MRKIVGGGVFGWLVTKLMLFFQYVETVGGFGQVDWYAVVTSRRQADCY